jgi:hypothetical protein
MKLGLIFLNISTLSRRYNYFCCLFAGFPAREGKAKENLFKTPHRWNKMGAEMIAEQIIRFLGMKPLADEGGYYVETCWSRGRKLFRCRT